LFYLYTFNDVAFYNTEVLTLWSIGMNNLPYCILCDF